MLLQGFDTSLRCAVSNTPPPLADSPAPAPHASSVTRELRPLWGIDGLALAVTTLMFLLITTMPAAAVPAHRHAAGAAAVAGPDDDEAGPAAGPHDAHCMLIGSKNRRGWGRLRRGSDSSGSSELARLLPGPSQAGAADPGATAHGALRSAIHKVQAQDEGGGFADASSHFASSCYGSTTSLLDAAFQSASSGANSDDAQPAIPSDHGISGNGGDVGGEACCAQQPQGSGGGVPSALIVVLVGLVLSAVSHPEALSSLKVSRRPAVSCAPARHCHLHNHVHTHSLVLL